MREFYEYVQQAVSGTVHTTVNKYANTFLYHDISNEIILRIVHDAF